MGKEHRRYQINGELIEGGIPTVEFAVDISNPTMKVYKNNVYENVEFTEEIDPKSLKKEEWEQLLGHIPIVRCKYCCYGKPFHYVGKDIVLCGLLNIKRLEDDFCSDGRM